MDTRRSRGMLLGVGLLAIAVASVAGIALARSSNEPSTVAQVSSSTTATTPPAEEAGDATPEKPSSVTVPASQAASESADEGPALQGLAKITADQAKAAAIAAVPGTATKVELENKDGSVVYAVEVTGADGKVTDFRIDAGNGAVLSRETESESPEGSSTEPNEPPKPNEPAEAPETPEAPDRAGD